MTDKVIVEEKAKKLIEMTSGFSDKYLDEDYKQLCEKLILKMKGKRNVPFASQKAKLILDTFKMSYYDEEFSTERMKERNPFAKMAIVNGFIVPIEAIESIGRPKKD